MPRHLYLAVLLFALLISPHLTFAQNTQLNIAVNDLIGKNIESGTAGIISDRLRAELINTNVFRVMERGEMNEVMKEQAFQQSGACDESSCLVEIGQVLGVDRIIAGSVGKIGLNLYTISLRIIDVATGEILLTVHEDFEGDIKGLLSIAVSQSAKKLAGTTFDHLKRIEMANRKGDIYISSQIPGAEIEINGEVINSVTPMTLYDFTAGKSEVVVRKGEYYGFATIDLVPDDLLKINIPMKKGTGAIKIFSNPVGAMVFIDDDRKGSTPLKVDGLTAGEHSITIVNHGSITYKGIAMIGVGEVRTMNVDLDPASYLELSVSPNDAEVYINDSKVKLVANMEITPGSKTVKVKRDGYDTYEQTFTAIAGESEKINVNLKYLLGQATIVTKPSKAVLFIDSKNIGHTPCRVTDLKPGKHKLLIENLGYKSITDEIMVEKGSIIGKEYTLERSKAWKDSVAAANLYEKNRKKKISKWVRRVVSGTAALAFGAGAIYSNQEAQKDLEKAENIQKLYDSHNDQFDGSGYIHDYNVVSQSADTHITRRNVFTGFAGGFLVMFGISIPF